MTYPLQPRKNLQSPFLFVSKMQILSRLRAQTWRKIYREIITDRIRGRDLKHSTMNNDPLRGSDATESAAQQA